jgi:hypothetical protein
MTERLKGFLFGDAAERAQAMTEYILVVTLFMIGAAYSFNLFGRILIAYYESVSLFAALPIP